jgi:RimJ/RimL family protein N-acetyltransferase
LTTEFRAVCTVRSETALFETGAFLATELRDADIPALQRFFEDNPEYFLAVSGQPPEPNEAHEEVHGAPPQGWTYTRKWLIGFEDPSGALVGMANVISDLLAPGIWHVGLFIVATRLHGAGTAQSTLSELERWACDLGARWLRLGVVKGNRRAERFWERRGFVEVRERSGIAMGMRINTVRVMAKPLAAGTLDQYLTLVPRDRRGAP